jgi:curli biogenesis system outer membrane secretion channel CsgG
MISDLSPDYPDVKLKLKDMETAILARAQKSIAVIPFKTAGVAEDMGTIITSNIMFSLLRQMSTEIRIIERSDIDILLREYELAVAGNMTENSGETGSFEIKSADYLLMGDVLDSRTETNIQNSRKKVRVQTGEKKVHSIEYEDWAVKYEKLQAEGQKVPPAPEKYVMEPVMEDVEYDVSYHSKVSYLNVSYRIVETSQGKVIYNNSSQAQKEARDEASGGVELGAYKIPMKVAALPTDIELSNQVRNEVIDKIVSDIKGIFKDPEQKYFLEAQKLETEGNIHGAIEKYADTILIRKVKSIDTSEMEEKVGKYLDVYGSI